jgi:hypothetical protein
MAKREEGERRGKKAQEPGNEEGADSPCDEDDVDGDECRVNTPTTPFPPALMVLSSSCGLSYRRTPTAKRSKLSLG